jgi:Ser/Thr protein kinase RdoA (MazF antagonist)
MIAVSSLERAAGRPVEPRDPAEWNDAFFTRWGRAMGRIHALTRRYRPAHPHADWRAEHDDLAAACGDADILARWNHLGDTIRGLPQPTDAYGLVHNDLHPWNFFIHHDELVLFDFGSCAHNWFVADIAIPMYWAAWAGTTHAGESPLDYLRRFAHHFMAGYEGENGLDRQWLEHLPLFMKHRQILLFIYFSYARSVNPWLRAHLLGDAERMIRADEPVIDGVFW